MHDVLADAGFKRGGAREQVIELLAQEPCALTAGEIETALRESGRSPGRASIYRVLDQLVEHGLAERVEVGDGQARFERQQPGGEHHHHIVCEGCGRLIAFDDPGLERAIARLSQRLGMRISG
ncbi:MAG: Fur family transcriptional regulator, partial [Solirubrobacteraceae bacterium]